MSQFKFGNISATNVQMGNHNTQNDAVSDADRSQTAEPDHLASPADSAGAHSRRDQAADHPADSARHAAGGEAS